VSVLVFVCVLGKSSKKAKWGRWKIRSYVLICSPQSCKKGLLTQMLQQRWLCSLV